jgi:hypothetical protein
MAGVLYAKVDGAWVPVQQPPAATDEVWVGSDDPGVGSSYEIWYDPDDDGVQYGTYAQGVTNLGAMSFGTGTLMPAAGGADTTVASLSNFFYASGRRYRLLLELNAITAIVADANGTASGSFGLMVDGVAQAGGVHFQTSLPSGTHTNFMYEWFLEKYGMSAGLHTLQVFWTPSLGQIRIYNDVGTFEVRDVGPANPMNPLTVTTPPAWIPFPFAAGWQSYPGFQTCGYRRLGDMVFLRGLAQINTALGTPSSTIGTLPSGYRPPGTHLFASPVGEPNAVIRTEVNSAGGVTCGANPLTNTNWCSLAPMSFSVTPG